MTSLGWRLIAAAACMIAVGCERERAEPREAPSPEAVQMSSAVIEAISSARCERERRCGHIGETEDYASPQHCLASIRAEWQEELGAYACTEGVREHELTECVEEILNEDCGNPLDTLERVVACRSYDICA